MNGDGVRKDGEANAPGPLCFYFPWAMAPRFQHCVRREDTVMANPLTSHDRCRRR